VTFPVTAAPPAPATARVKVPGAVIVTGSIAVLNVAFTALLSSTLMSVSAGLVSVIVGAVVFGPAAVVKFQGLGLAPATKALPLRSLAAVVTVAVNCVFGARFAVGVNVAAEPA
jgi:hypothetical protein